MTPAEHYADEGHNFGQVPADYENAGGGRPVTTEPETLAVIAGHLVTKIDHCNCGTDLDATMGQHEDACGWEPIATIAEVGAAVAVAHGRDVAVTIAEAEASGVLPTMYRLAVASQADAEAERDALQARLDAALKLIADHGADEYPPAGQLLTRLLAALKGETQ